MAFVSLHQEDVPLREFFLWNTKHGGPARQNLDHKKNRQLQRRNDKKTWIPHALELVDWLNEDINSSIKRTIKLRTCKERVHSALLSIIIIIDCNNIIVNINIIQEPISRSEQLPYSGVTAFSRTELFLVHSSREFRPITCVHT